jgi:hypothetical protein
MDQAVLGWAHTSGPMESFAFGVMPAEPMGVSVAAVMNSLLNSSIGEVTPPLPITKTLRTFLLTDQLPVALSQRYGYLPSVCTANCSVPFVVPIFFPSLRVL